MIEGTIVWSNLLGLKVHLGVKLCVQGEKDGVIIEICLALS